MIVFIHHSVNPYRIALFNKLANSTTLKFKVFFLSAPAQNRRWEMEDFDINFQYMFLKGKKLHFPGSDHSYFDVNVGVWSSLKKENPDVIISFGWNFLAAYLAFVFSKLSNTKFVLWSGSTKFEKSYIRTLSLPLVKLVVYFTDGFIAYGTRAREYLKSLGAKSERIHIAYNTVDTKSFINKSKGQKKAKEKIFQKYGIDPKKRVILFVGQYIKRKGVYLILNIAKKLKEKEETVFLLAGYGPEKQNMEKYVEKHELDNVILTGFIKNKQLVDYYAACDIFILPSHEEVWGLVVNEAMCAGKPVLVSKYAGCAEDLVKKGKNGFIIDTETADGVVEKIEYLLENENRLMLFGRNSEKIIKKFSLDQNIKTIKKLMSSLNKI